MLWSLVATMLASERIIDLQGLFKLPEIGWALNLGCVRCRPPFVFIDTTRRGNAAFFGFLVDLLPVLFQTANLGNYTFDFYSSTNSGGEKLDNGTWTGMSFLHSVSPPVPLAVYPIQLLLLLRDFKLVSTLCVQESWANCSLGKPILLPFH